jgi:pimeloyl-ACP methyl ester carboxylesterase
MKNAHAPGSFRLANLARLVLLTGAVACSGPTETSEPAVAITNAVVQANAESPAHAGGGFRPQTFLFVHGAWHGSWAWDGLAARIQRAGHRTVAVDVAGRAGDTTPVGSITLDLVVQQICGVAGNQGQPVILVGHSLGGIEITQAAEVCPESVKKLVYISGFLPQNGESLMTLASTPAGSTAEVMPYLVFPPVDGLLHFRPGTPFKDIFYGDAADADVTRAVAALVPEPAALVITPVKTTAERFGRIPRDYISFLDDHALPLALQRQMVAALPCNVTEMHGSHTAWLTAPGEVARVLVADYGGEVDVAAPPPRASLFGH